jgi:hypothetical protein
MPPSFEPRRRNPRAGLLLLPAKGFEGEVPRWPLPGRFTGAERLAWDQLWRTPQAFAWAQLGWTRTVARYCRLMVRAEKPGATAAVAAQVTALEDRLGLTPKSMRLLLWQVAPDETAERRAEQAAPERRAHLRAVDPDDAAEG